MRRWAALAHIVALGVAMGVSSEVQVAAEDPLQAVSAALQAGEVDRAMTLLRALPQDKANSAAGHNLKCRVFFAIEDWDPAVNECMAAVTLDGQNSDYHLWLGRSLGEKADKASFVTAYSLAKRARVEFETAVTLNPRNVDALADLGDFYNQAPAVVGGGTAKAEAVAGQLASLDPAEAHKLRGFIADGDKDYVTTERELKASLASSPHPALQWMTLASFYRRRQRWDDMETALQSGFGAAQRDPRAGESFYNGASVLIKAQRDTPMAIRMLEAYLASPSKAEQSPAFKADVLLAKLEAETGDRVAAQRDRNAALALAGGYLPAQELKF